MTDQWPEELILAGAELKEFLLRRDPKYAGAIFVGFLATVVGQLPEPYWWQMMVDASRPCGAPGCDCEATRAPLMAALDGLRREYQDELRRSGFAE